MSNQRRSFLGLYVRHEVRHQCKLRKMKNLLYGKVRKVTSFLHSGNRGSVNADLAEHLIKILVHSLTLHSCVKGMLHERWRSCWTQTLWAALQCAGLLCGSPAHSQSYWNRILPRQSSRQENLHNRAKISGSGVKEQKDAEDCHPSSGSRAFYPKTPNRTIAPIVQR